MKILWVEDQPDENHVLMKRLLRNGYELESAERVDDGIRHLSQSEYDVLIVDLLVPLGDGPEVAGFEHRPDNGRYVLDFARTLDLPTRLICFTNFAVTSEQLGGEVSVLRKSCYLSEFERAVHGVQ